MCVEKWPIKINGVATFDRTTTKPYFYHSLYLHTYIQVCWMNPGTYIRTYVYAFKVFDLSLLDRCERG